MQLVLGIRIGTGSLAAADAPAPPALEPALGQQRLRRALRSAAWAAALSGIAALGVIQGARVAIGAEGVSALARGESDLATGSALERDELRGTLWRPAGSSAERPGSALRARRWEPDDR